MIDTPPANWYDRRPDEPLCSWVDRVLQDERTNRQIADHVWHTKRAELAWLRASMTAGGIPADIQAFVIEQW